MAEISILCGLGNPGSQYTHTRHNLGAETLDVLAGRHRLVWRKVSAPALETLWECGERQILLVKPLTFMNASGEALLHYGDFVPSSLLVVCDDINLPLGRMRLRRSGGSGGHLGIESIISCIDDDGFARLRIGVGSPPPGIDWSDYVLERFPVSEREAANRLVDTAADAIEIIVRDGLGAAMQEYNRRDQS